jgi:hypothetical protein
VTFKLHKGFRNKAFLCPIGHKYAVKEDSTPYLLFKAILGFKILPENFFYIETEYLILRFQNALSPSLQTAFSLSNAESSAGTFALTVSPSASTLTNKSKQLKAT